MVAAAQEDSKEAGLIILKIKRIKCLAARAANTIRSVPSVGALGMRKQGDLCVGFVCCSSLPIFQLLSFNVALGKKWKLTRNMSRPGKFRLMNRTNLESNRVPLFRLRFGIDHLVCFFSMQSRIYY